MSADVADFMIGATIAIIIGMVPLIIGVFSINTKVKTNKDKIHFIFQRAQKAKRAEEMSEIAEEKRQEKMKKRKVKRPPDGKTNTGRK